MFIWLIWSTSESLSQDYLKRDRSAQEWLPRLSGVSQQILKLVAEGVEVGHTAYNEASFFSVSKFFSPLSDAIAVFNPKVDDVRHNHIPVPSRFMLNGFGGFDETIKGTFVAP